MKKNVKNLPIYTGIAKIQRFFILDLRSLGVFAGGGRDGDSNDWVDSYYVVVLLRGVFIPDFTVVCPTLIIL